MTDQFTLPLALDLAATFFFAISGGLTAMRKGYDFVGLFFLALVTGLGGGLLRDGIFLQQIPAAIEPHYLVTVIAAMIISLLFGDRLNRFVAVFLVVDALGLGLYAVVGTQKALAMGLPWISALLIGVINAVGGGIIRDLITREEPIVFRPGEFYAAAAFVGCAAFVGLVLAVGLPNQWAAFAGIGLILLVRLASVRFGWKTRAADALVKRTPRQDR